MRQPWVHGYARRNGLVHIGTPEDGALCGRRMRIEAESVSMPTCRDCVRWAQRRGGLIYLLHFSEPYAHARHYLGWTKDLAGRMWCHRAGRGAKLLVACNDAGITYEVVALFYGDRNEERAMKNHGHARRCPACKEWNRLTAALGKVDNEVISRSTAIEER